MSSFAINVKWGLDNGNLYGQYEHKHPWVDPLGTSLLHFIGTIKLFKTIENI
jgi:hypothetical protein